MRLRPATSLLVGVLFAAAGLVAVRCEAPKTAEPSRIVGRADPIENRADFIGYRLLSNGSFEAEFCNNPGDTVTTIGTLLDCCPQGNSCKFGITCSSGYLVSAVLTSPPIEKTTKFECAAVVTGSACVVRYVYDNLAEKPADSSTSMPGLWRWYDCGSWRPSTKRTSYYRTLTEGADVTIYTPSWGAGQALLTSPPGSTPSTGLHSLSTPTSSTRSIVNNQSTTENASPSSSTNGSAPSGDSESTANLSRSDQIAIGIGLGIGLPTVLIGLLAWFYPRRHRVVLARARVPQARTPPAH